MHPKGISCGASSVKFIERLDLEEKISFMDRHWLKAGAGGADELPLLF